MNFEEFSWDEISQLYEELSELNQDQRESFYNEHNTKVGLKEELEALIELNDSSKTYFDNLSQNIISPAIFEISDLPPSSGRVYNYKILKKIGRGGMGSVYLAERDDDAYKSLVAVKILRRGLKNEEIIVGFKSERQILAQLNHPNITHLLDGGMTTDGRPYFVMEYVEGKPITEYCDEKKLTLTDRINLFNQICDTLAYAHQNLVIHRDLKPANILVTKDGIVKLLDFGIAKFIDEKSSLLKNKISDEKRLLTPEYASPEQIKGVQMNTSSDIYQLGLVFYKLISGQSPFNFQEKSFAETKQIILKKAPPAPSDRFQQSGHQEKKEIADKRSTNALSLKKDLRNDLDYIALMALQKKPEKRYKSILEFKEDLERFQNDFPVISRGNNIKYKSIKYIKRNKFNIAVSLLFLTMLFSFAFIYNFSVTEQRNYAQQEALKASQVTSFLIDLFEANDPDLAQGVDFTASELLESGLERIEMLEDLPEVQSDLYEVTGQIYRKLGQFDEAEQLYQTALELRENSIEPNHQEIASIYNQLGLLYSDIGDFERAEQILRDAIELANETFVIPDPIRSESITNLAYVLRRTGNYDEAERMYRESYRIRNRSLGSEHPSTIETLSSIGVTLLNKGDYNGAKSILQDVLELRLNTLGPSHPDVAMSMNSLGAVLLYTGQFEDAEDYFRESLRIRTKLFGELHPKVALSMNNLGIALREQEYLDEAYDYMNRALMIRKESLGDQNINTAISLFTKGQLLLQMGDPDGAGITLKEANEIFQDQLGNSHSFTARSMISLGLSYLHSGELNPGEELIKRGYDGVLSIHNPKSLEVALAHWDYALYLKFVDRPDQALDYFHLSFNILQELESDNSIRIHRLIEQIHEVSQEDELIGVIRQ
jgi:eukaryotic-like serine/threonine-protein kinase